MVAQQLQFKWDQPSSSKGEACGEGGKVCQVTAAFERTEPVKTAMLEEEARRENTIRALKRVCAKMGCPGVDGMKVDELKGYLKIHWLDIQEKLLQGEYKPQPVKQVLLPKPGGTRKLGVPSVLDRFIQQALLQVLNPIYDPTFSEYSYGFRPGRNAHQAVRQAKKYIGEGHE